ncbi:NAD-P-binding protein [Epithele typhae]|uniref:NAD-P-binding protein n=1 Tax=Epithele typhae TaxID=378194 RepID=UPI002008DCFC|nr:NAD-P-binding protein [Epithele typhae]KAH9912964.1 NAD-P-binding protein [Epithele typhae]
MSTSPRVWFITGSSTGLGLELTRRALAAGDTVVATLRTPAALSSLSAAYGPDHLLVLPLDVASSPAAVSAAFDAALARFGRIDVVVSNAGVSVLGEVEGTPDDVARAMLEVNFWGAAHVLQSAVRVLRERNPPGAGGRILQVTSGVALSGYPGCGFYAASKHAIEGLTESLAGEIDPEWNIHITMVTLGGFRTSAVSTGMTKTPAHPAYTKPTLPSAMSRAAILSSLAGTEKDPAYPVRGDPVKAADALYRFSASPAPPVRLLLGNDVIGLAKHRAATLVEEAGIAVPWSADVEVDE